MNFFLNFHGLTVEVRDADTGLADEVRRDFAFFVAPERDPQIRIELHEGPPPYESLPPIRASFFTPRTVCFQNGAVSYLDYFGQGLGIYDRRAGVFQMHGADRHLVHEAAYLFILSTVGAYLDKQGLHRLHALGVSLHGAGILILLPSGGGKSTLALELLRQPDVQLLSEDTPLIDRRGRIHPFPLRLGVRPDQDPGVPPEFLRTVRRMEFDPKKLIDITYYQDRLGGVTAPAMILVGERNLGNASSVEPLGRARAFKALLKYMVVGLGVYQGLEFILERGAGELLGKTGVVASRFYNSLQLLSRAPAFRFVMGRDRKKNTQTLLDHMRTFGAGSMPAARPPPRTSRG